MRAVYAHFGTPDVIHVNVNPPIGLIFYLRLGLRKIPYIFTEHWSGYFPSSGQYRHGGNLDFPDGIDRGSEFAVSFHGIGVGGPFALAGRRAGGAG